MKKDSKSVYLLAVLNELAPNHNWRFNCKSHVGSTLYYEYIHNDESIFKIDVEFGGYGIPSGYTWSLEWHDHNIVKDHVRTRLRQFSIYEIV